MLDFFAAADPYILLWIILLIGFVVIELATVGLVSIWFGAGALVALIVAALGGGLLFQILAFIFVSFGLLFATRSWAKKFINNKTQKTNVDSLVGKTVRITQRVSNLDQTGAAVLSGQEWTARADDDKEIFEQGELAKVVRISGVKLIIERKKED